MPNTTNYNLIKQDENWKVSIEDINNNMDIIDEAIRVAYDSATTKYTKPVEGIPHTDFTPLVLDVFSSVIPLNEEFYQHLNDDENWSNTDYIPFKERVTQHLDEDASKTRKGHMQAGLGLNAVGGVVNSEYHRTYNSLPSNTDLNDYFSLDKIGTYSIVDGVTFNTFLNKPSNHPSANANLTVKATNGSALMQILEFGVASFSTTNNNANLVFRRTKSGSNITPWVTEYNSQNLRSESVVPSYTIANGQVVMVY